MISDEYDGLRAPLRSCYQVNLNHVVCKRSKYSIKIIFSKYFFNCILDLKQVLTVVQNALLNCTLLANPQKSKFEIFFRSKLLVNRTYTILAQPSLMFKLPLVKMSPIKLSMSLMLLSQYKSVCTQVLYKQYNTNIVGKGASSINIFCNISPI